jgi:radical SAM superfamily enzyme YgiQ (UPF0313 family)
MTDVVLVDFIQNSPSGFYNLHSGLRYLAAYSRSKGLKVKILFNRLPFLSREELFIDFIGTIKKEKPLIIGLSPIDMNFPLICSFVEKLRKEFDGGLVVLGGFFATFNHDKILKDFDIFDVVVRGEGEITLFELASKVKEKQSLASVLGISYKKKKRVYVNNVRPQIQDLDSLPFPATDGFDEAKKISFKMEHVYLTSSRGCYMNCSFCSARAFYKYAPGCKAWRSRSPKNFAEEIQLLNTKYGIKRFCVNDDNFVGPGKYGEERIIKIIKEIASRRLKITLEVLARADNIDGEVFKSLKRAGLESVFLGVESGIQRALDLFNKKLLVRQNDAAIKLLRENNIAVVAGFIFFDPYMTAGDVSLNAAYLEKLLKNKVDFFPTFPLHPLMPYSGAAILSQLKEDKLLTGDYKNGYFYKFRDKRINDLCLFVRYLLKNQEACLDGLGRGFNKGKIFRVMLRLDLKLLKTAGQILSKSKKITMAKMLSSHKIGQIICAISNEIEQLEKRAGRQAKGAGALSTRG